MFTRRAGYRIDHRRPSTFRCTTALVRRLVRPLRFENLEERRVLSGNGLADLPVPLGQTSVVGDEENLVSGGTYDDDSVDGQLMPEVVEVFLRGQAWNDDASRPLLLGGFDLQEALPWVGLDQIDVVFSENVDVTSDSLTLVGVEQLRYRPSTFHYDPATFKATWTFPDTFGAEKLLLNIAGQAVDVAAVREASSAGTLLGGGQDFELCFDILPGDVTGDGRTDVGDLVNIATRVGSTMGLSASSIDDARYDVTGDGGVDVGDLVNTATRVPSQLPAGEPLTADELVLLERYWLTADQFAAWHYDEYFASIQADVGDCYACFEGYDAPYVFWNLERLLENPATQQKAWDYAVRLTDDQLIPYIMGPPERGAQGWRAYNKGVAALAGDTRIDEATREQYQTAAINIAYRSPFSNVVSMTPDHASWDYWKNTLYSREFALAVLAHLVVRPWTSDDEAQADYMRTVVRELILDEHLPYWINAAEQGYSEAVIGDEWLPFMFAHTARTLIRYYEDDFDHSMNEEILQSLDTLARLTWDVAYREKDALFGLFYRADGTGDESPAPDLSLFTMPWYAWL